MEHSLDFLDVLVQRLGLAHDLPQVGWALREFAADLGLRHSIYYLASVPGDPERPPVQLTTYPKEWKLHYYERNYLAIDPCVTVPAQGILPTDWASFTKRSPSVKSLFGEARENGVGPQGLTIPVRGCKGEAAVVCFTSEETDAQWQGQKGKRLPLLHTGSFLIHERVMELIGANDLSSAPALSPRELDCLKYCAAGFRDEQIAETLKISAKVVNAYLDSMRHKLKAATRPNAIARAVRLGLISVDVIEAKSSHDQFTH